MHRNNGGHQQFFRVSGAYVGAHAPVRADMGVRGEMGRGALDRDHYLAARDVAH